MEPRELTLLDAATELHQGRLSAVELAVSCLEQIDALNPKLNAFIHLRAVEEVLADARKSDERRRQGAAGTLEGVPIGLKANYACAGLPASAGSRILAHWRPRTDAATVTHLRQAGVVILGMTNMHEFADGPTNENPHFGRALNPHDPSRTPGGSSGGSAVAVQADMCLAATGTDDGGSIRIPASFCGVAGLKPTYGLVTVEGIVPFSPSLDHAGPLAGTPQDAQALLHGMLGLPETSEVSRRTIERGRRTVVGVERNYFGRYLTTGVGRAFEEALTTFNTMGFDVREVTLPSVEKACTALLVILFSEAAAVHDDFLEDRLDEYSKDVRLSLLSGRLYRAVDYVNARTLQRRFRDELDGLFRDVDVLVTPTAVLEPPYWDTPLIRTDEGEVELLETIIRCTAPFDLSGHPAMSVPCGSGEKGLPVGLQLVGPMHSEALLTDIGQAFLAARSI